MRRTLLVLASLASAPTALMAQATVAQPASTTPPALRAPTPLVLPKIKDFDHIAAPDVQLNQHRH